MQRTFALHPLPVYSAMKTSSPLQHNALAHSTTGTASVFSSPLARTALLACSATLLMLLAAPVAAAAPAASTASVRTKVRPNSHTAAKTAALGTTHNNAQASAPVVLAAHPVLHGLAQELVRGSRIEIMRVTPADLPASRHPAYLTGRGLEALQSAASQAQAVLSMRSIWPDDQLYPLARRSNIRIVEIDTANPIEGDLPGLTLNQTQGHAIQTQPWLASTNLARMATLIVDALARLHPASAKTLEHNLQKTSQQLQQLEINTSQALASAPNLSVVVLSPRLQTLAQALDLEILPWAAPADPTQAAPALQALLQREKVALVLHHTTPDAAQLQAIQNSGAQLLIVREFSANPITELQQAVQNAVKILNPAAEK